MTSQAVVFRKVKGGFAAAEWTATMVLAVVVAGLVAASTGSERVAFEHVPGAQEAEPYRLRVDINRDPWQRITLVPGIGERTAKSIVARREEHGPFRSLDELQAVHGIGPRRLEQWRPHLKPLEEQPERP